LAVHLRRHHIDMADRRRTLAQTKDRTREIVK